MSKADAVISATSIGSGGAPVVVIGHAAWRLRFNADPHVVGRTMQLGGTLHTVVAVMPDGFAFPMDDQFWIPLRLDPSKYRRWEGLDLALRVDG
jgi:putative ABC transport system permease protein